MAGVIDGYQTCCSRKLPNQARGALKNRGNWGGEKKHLTSKEAIPIVNMQTKFILKEHACSNSKKCLQNV